LVVATFVSNAALALWCGQNLVSTLAIAAYRRGLPRPELPGSEPSVAVILPVKGGAHLAGLLPCLRAQRYSRYRIVASVESKEDPAFAILSAARREPGAPLDVVVAGLAENAGQKVWNLLAALDRLSPEDEIVAFLDADVLLTPLWLPRLVAVIVNSGRPVATGYRWMIPSDDRWSSACLAAASLARRVAARRAAADHRLGRQRRDETNDARDDPRERILAGRDQR
jgi:cellulose synthase/poly-beta-1,6-N-acetylglucosamine synthase-like glycosyltransferase